MSTDSQNPPPSFTGKAIATLVIYCFLWLPGLIANIVFYNEAKAAARRYNQPIPGSGCLVAMLWLQGIAVVLLVLIGISIAASA